MKCIVTGITEMSGSNVCMSLYSIEHQCYIRPLKNGRNFNEAEINGIYLYSVVNIVPSEDELELQYPHCEDLNITLPYFTFIRMLTDQELYDFFDQTAYASAEEIFGEGNLIRQGRSWGVVHGTGERSLGSVEVEEFEIFRDDYDPNKPKFKVNFTDLSGQTYKNVALVMKDNLTNKMNMIGIHNKDNDEERIFLRLSLARKWNNGSWEKEMCTLQVSCYVHFE